MTDLKPDYAGNRSDIEERKRWKKQEKLLKKQRRRQEKNKDETPHEYERTDGVVETES